MHPFLDNPALKVYALTCSILVLHMFFLGFWTGATRARRKSFVNPEDTSDGKIAEAEHPDVLRVKRAHMNAIENVPLFFAIGLLYALSGASTLGAQAYCYTFLGARILHSIFYLRGIQPFRSIAYGIGALATLGMLVHVIRMAI